MENRIDDDIQSVQRKQRRNSLFISTAGTFQFLAGILSATGLAITLPALMALRRLLRLQVRVWLAGLVWELP